MESNTRSIVELAWARELGLDQHALLRPYPERVLAVRDDVVMVLTLWQHSVLVAPERVLARAASWDTARLQDSASLLQLITACGRRGRQLGQTHLSFTDAYVPEVDEPIPPVTTDPAAVTELERRCPPDDVQDVRLSARSWQVAALDWQDRTTAAAGFDERQHILADLAVLTDPAQRRHGWGTITAALAVNEALDRGLVPQWHSNTGHAASRRLAQRLGFEIVGSQTLVHLLC